MGHLGKDPEIRYMPNGNAVASFSIATSEKWKDKQTGEPQERTEWHNIVFFGKAAETIGQYCKKGSALFVEGSIKTEKWQDQEGNDRYTTKIIGREFQFLSGKPEKKEESEPKYYPGASDDSFDNDIPFV